MVAQVWTNVNKKQSGSRPPNQEKKLSKGVISHALKLMDWSKYPLEKLFSFIAALIPGFTALIISGHALNFVLLETYLGYRTKISILVIVGFIVGFTMTTILGAILGAVGGAIGGARYKTPDSYEVAPWRDPRWRALIKTKLRDNCPKDTSLISSALSEYRTKWIESLPKEQQQEELFKLRQEKFDTESNDRHWAMWYDHYHQICVQPDESNIYQQIHTGLRFSLQTASVYCLVSAIWIPSVRRWWCLVPAVFWTLMMVLESVDGLKKAINKWSTLNEQIKYLTNNIMLEFI